MSSSSAQEKSFVDFFSPNDGPRYGIDDAESTRFQEYLKSDLLKLRLERFKQKVKKIQQDKDFIQQQQSQ